MNTPHPIFVQLAGFLAERGVHELIVSSGEGSQVLRSRHTDLPGTLQAAAAHGATVSIPRLNLEIAIDAKTHALRWTCPDAALTVAIAKALAPLS